MRRYIARNVLIARLAVMALVALCFPQPQVRAQGMTGVIVIFPSVGLAPGQSLRLTLFNPDGEPVRAQAGLHNANGNLILLADGSVRGGAFHSFDFSRRDIPLAGEEVTGRIQLSATFEIRMAEPRKKLAVSMETISISDGTSNTVFVGEIPPSPGGGGRDILVGGDARDILMGIAPGQTLRVTILNPKPLGLDYLPSRVKIFDADGNLISQSDELVIPSGELRSFDVNRDALPLLGEPGTNRIQMRIKPFFNFESKRLPTPPSSDRLLTDVISFEVVDNSTGKTVVLSGHECLVFFLGGIPGN
jgi:hypothetical protein